MNSKRRTVTYMYIYLNMTSPFSVFHSLELTGKEYCSLVGVTYTEVTQMIDAFICIHKRRYMHFSGQIYGELMTLSFEPRTPFIDIKIAPPWNY